MGEELDLCGAACEQVWSRSTDNELERPVSHGCISTVKSLVSSNRGNRLSGWGIDLFFSLATVYFQISNILWLSVFLLLLFCFFSAFILFF